MLFVKKEKEKKNHMNRYNVYLSTKHLSINLSMIRDKFSNFFRLVVLHAGIYQNQFLHTLLQHCSMSRPNKH